MPQEVHDFGRDGAELLECRVAGEVLTHDLHHRPVKGRAARKHIPERHAETVNVRADIQIFLLELFGTREMRRADESRHGDRRGGFRAVLARDLGEAEIDDFHVKALTVIVTFLVILAQQHEVGGLDVAMDEPDARRRAKRARDLERDPERERRLQRTPAADERLERFAVDELHRVEVVAALLAEVENARDVMVAQPRRGTCLAQKTLPRRVAIEERGIDYLERDMASQARIEGLVRHLPSPRGQAPRGNRRAS